MLYTVTETNPYSYDRGDVSAHARNSLPTVSDTSTAHMKRELRQTSMPCVRLLDTRTTYTDGSYIV